VTHQEQEQEVEGGIGSSADVVLEAGGITGFKTKLRNKISDGELNDLMVCYIEQGIFKSLDLYEIKKDYQNAGRALPLPWTSRHH
jgi:hypothetical protein